MAAEALMTGADNYILDRLKAVSLLHTENVLPFAVKCFVEKEHLLDNVVSICEGLNDDKAAGKVFGDEIAGESSRATLWDRDWPWTSWPMVRKTKSRIRKSVGQNRLELIRLADPEVAAQLAAIYHEDMAGAFRELRRSAWPIGFLEAAWRLVTPHELGGPRRSLGHAAGGRPVAQ
jgi:hypothetical protein